MLEEIKQKFASPIAKITTLLITFLEPLFDVKDKVPTNYGRWAVKLSRDIEVKLRGNQR